MTNISFSDFDNMNPEPVKIAEGEYGFAKIRGYSFWPARITGECKGRVWVKFFGTNDLGTVNKKNNWVSASASSLKKYATTKMLGKPRFQKGISDFANNIKGG